MVYNICCYWQQTACEISTKFCARLFYREVEENGLIIIVNFNWVPGCILFFMEVLLLQGIRIFKEHLLSIILQTICLATLCPLASHAIYAYDLVWNELIASSEKINLIFHTDHLGRV